MTASNPNPDGYRTLTPFLAVRGGAAIDFYQSAMGAEVVDRMDGPGGVLMHAELRIGDSMLRLSDEEVARRARTLVYPDAVAAQ